MPSLTDLRARRARVADAIAATRSDLSTQSSHAVAVALGAENAQARRWSAWQDARRALLDGAPVAEVDGWASPRWSGWDAQPGAMRVLRVGDVVDQHGDALLPALVPFVGSGRPLVVSSRGAAQAERARSLLNALALRVQLGLGAGVRLHLLDAAQRGYAFPVATDLLDARYGDDTATLSALLEACRSIKTAFGFKPFDALDAAARGHHKHSGLVVADFPEAYTSAQIDLIHQAVREQPAGVLVIVHHNLDADRPGPYDDLQVTNPVVVSLTDNGVAVLGLDGRVRLDEAVDHGRAAELLGASRTVSQAVATVGWERGNSRDPGTWWTGSAAAGATGVLGVRKDGTPLTLQLGGTIRDSASVHAAMTGSAGSGKSTLIYNLITSLVTRYSPDELRLYFVDGQDGVNFAAFQGLPHTEVVSLRSTPDVARAVLAELVDELRRRSSDLTDADTDKFEKLPDGERPPRLVLVIDEYQTLFEGDTDGTASEHLTLLSKLGRKAGITFLVSSQDLVVPGLRNATSIFANITSLISFRLASTTSNDASHFGPDGRRMIAEWCTEHGKVVLKDPAGPTEGVVARLALEEAQQIVREVVELGRNRGYAGAGTVVLDGMLQPRLAESPALRALRAARPALTPGSLAELAVREVADGGLGFREWLIGDRNVPLLWGRTVSVREECVSALGRRAQENVLVTGQNREVTIAAVTTALTTAALASPAGSLAVDVLRLPTSGGSWDGLLDRVLPDLYVRCGHRWTGAGTDLAGLLAELDRRRGLPAADLALEPTRLVVAADLDRDPAYSMTGGDYGDEASAATTDLARLLAEGPQVGMHVIAVFDGVPAWRRVLPTRTRAQFRHLVMQQMSQDDSLALLQNSDGHRIAGSAEGALRAGYVNQTAGTLTLLFPCTTGAQRRAGEQQPTLADDVAGITP